MSHLLLNLRHVPDDEADAVRALLTQNGIAYYETEANRWGISAGAIWVREDAQLADARRLMGEYQARRKVQARDDYAAAKRDGTVESFWAQLRSQPLRVILILIGIAICAALSLWPLLLAGR
jgi:hypothetical protein